MSLPHAILGFLQMKPMTGYDLKTDCFDRSVAFFWPADQAQIYRTLDKLAEQGLVESHVELQEERPNRKVYQITDRGREELARWLQTATPLPTYREPFLVQLFFAGQLGNAEVIELLKAQAEAHQARLADYHSVPLPRLDDPGIDRSTTFQRFTLELGLRTEEAYIAWLESAIAFLKNSA